MYNPRFPNKLSIKRAKVDYAGLPVLDYDGTPSYETLTLAKAVYFDGEVVRDDEGNVCTENVTEIEVGNRLKSRPSTQSDVITPEYEYHAPLLVTELKFGDIATITSGSDSWTATIVDKKNFNWGSIIYINEAKN